MNILHENCDPKLAEDPKLPYTAYLIQYADKEVVKFDLSIGYSTVELFDHYYDKYKNVMSMIQSNGKVNPNYGTHLKQRNLDHLSKHHLDKDKSNERRMGNTLS